MIGFTSFHSKVTAGSLLLVTSTGPPVTPVVACAASTNVENVAAYPDFGSLDA